MALEVQRGELPGPPGAKRSAGRTFIPDGAERWLREGPSVHVEDAPEHTN
ncbi:MAG TPA: hypothetical protein VGL53_05145 [Bryobacteraceae bacterium]